MSNMIQKQNRYKGRESIDDTARRVQLYVQRFAGVIFAAYTNRKGSSPRGL
jgi:hypothetical protein